ncbi:Transcriptional regulator, contains XRE-family HTH domain [Catalinimonas alkaloidigena]|uniref:Transcriptional regulator, contains XRE-family HTH domain n=1 Tax=Catalinimonas alkaloidigena TaxID=1075417 RepID=A0A1G9NFT8_9BACT|nr:XRE family transcriptional regulator [Catalinimonas alkaloidigena]SDL85382.1 Transcriptional regulator, contains XRE-family HTH domain [Catalinimonas alkaloidigena]
MVKSDALSRIGRKIKEVRKDKRLSLKEVAEASKVTAGLLSKIENFRTIPSLPVLHSIANALDVSMAELVEPVHQDPMPPYLLIRQGEGETEDREDSEGLSYESLISTDFTNMNVRVNIVSIQPGVFRPPLATDAMELIHVLAGKVRYGVGDKTVDLQEGDTLFFNGRIAHSVENPFPTPGRLFKVYFLEN